MYVGWCKLNVNFCLIQIKVLTSELGGQSVQNQVTVIRLFWVIDRAPYLSAHVLLNLLNNSGEKIKSILTLFRNKFNKFNNTGAQMIDSIYHTCMTFKLFCNHVFRVETSRFCQIYVTLLWVLFHNVTKFCKPLVVYRF